MRGRWAVVENVSEMTVTAGANHFVSLHPGGAISARRYVFFGDRFPKARPARAGFEFRLGIEENRVATDAMVQAVVMIAGILAGEGPFGACMARDFELLRRQLLLPFGVGFDNFLDVDDACPHACGV